MYGTLAEQQKELKEKITSLTPEQRAAEEAELEMKANKVKKRMMGNIGFVGELYKKGFISTKIIMKKCINSLLANVDENDEVVAFKQVQNEQELELLCRFMHTVGSTLENKAGKKESDYNLLEMYFRQLVKLSKDKTVNSRIRFNIEEVSQDFLTQHLQSFEYNRNSGDAILSWTGVLQVIELRRNGWQARREQEGPATLDQIHQKILQEDLQKQQQSVRP